MALFVILLHILRWNLPIFLHYIKSGGIRILNTKKVGFGKAVFKILSRLCLLPLRKNQSDRFPWKNELQLKWSTYYPSVKVYGIHWRKREKIHSQFCFLCSCWRHKISKNIDVFLWACADYLSSCAKRACDRKTIGSHLKQTGFHARENLPVNIFNDKN